MPGSVIIAVHLARSGSVGLANPKTLDGSSSVVSTSNFVTKGILGSSIRDCPKEVLSWIVLSISNT